MHYHWTPYHTNFVILCSSQDLTKLIKPHYIIHGDNYQANCILTFPKESIFSNSITSKKPMNIKSSCIVTGHHMHKFCPVMILLEVSIKLIKPHYIKQGVNHQVISHNGWNFKHQIYCKAICHRGGECHTNSLLWRWYSKSCSANSQKASSTHLPNPSQYFTTYGLDLRQVPSFYPKRRPKTNIWKVINANKLSLPKTVKIPLPMTKVSFSQIELFFNSKGLAVQKSGVTTSNS